MKAPFPLNILRQKIEAPRRIELDILSQPDETTCGPTCLHSVYRFYNDHIDLEQVIREVHQFEDGGTLAVWLGCHALKRGYEAVLYTCSVEMFDPTWFTAEDVDLVEKLKQQMNYTKDRKFTRASKAVLDFLQLGGKIKFEDFSRNLLRRFLSQGVPILTGLSSTFLYRSAREISDSTMAFDDVRGEPAGHFVVLCGYNRATKRVLVADPHKLNPYSETHKYEVPIDRVICSILLGVLTYDANFLIIKK